MVKTRNDLGQNVRSKMIALLDENLAQAVDLSAQTKHAHWNVKGPHFIALHKFFDELHENVEAYTDTIAERLTSLGGMAHGTVQYAAQNSKLKPYPATVTDGMDHVDRLATAFSTFAKSTRKAIDSADEGGDQVTADVFTEVTRGLDQDLWFIEAHLQAKA